jgi:hypothetical protein
MHARCFPHTHARSHFRCTLAVSRTVRSLFPARPHCSFAALQSRTPASISCVPVHRTVRSPLPLHLAFPVHLLAASHFLLRLVLLLRLALPLRLGLPSASGSPPPRAPLRLASLRFAALSFTSPTKPSQAPNAIKTGYRTSRVWIWSSKNGCQGGVGQPSQECYRNDEMNSVKEE